MNLIQQVEHLLATSSKEQKESLYRESNFDFFQKEGCDVLSPEAVAPTVELDLSAHAAYVRFSAKKVERTVEITSCDCIVTVDLDSDGKTVGVELVGVKTNLYSN